MLANMLCFCETPYNFKGHQWLEGQVQGHKVVKVDVICKCLSLMNMHIKYEHLYIYRLKVIGKVKVNR